MRPSELSDVLARHRAWLYDSHSGARAVLRDADLRGADLRDADLRDADLRGADLTGADLRDADLTGAVLTGATGYRFRDAPDPMALRRQVADHIEAHPELHDQESWGDGSADPACGTPCCVAGWACHLGGGSRGHGVPSAATRLLWVDGLPMPDFSVCADRDGILAALRAEVKS
jgi:pentapeptide repeat protein